MAKKKKGSDAEEASGGKSRTVPAVIVAVALLGAGYMLGPGKSAAAPAAEAGPTTTTTILGPVAGLDPITLNLADGRYLKVAIALQLSAEAAEGGGGGHGGGGEDDTSAHWARALDATISVLGERTYNDLSAPGGRAKAKEELAHHIAELYHEEVVDVYFTEFVMQ